MKTGILWKFFVAAIVSLPVAAFAQNDRPGQWYLFGTAGTSGFGSGQKIGVGFGGERLVHAGIGVGGELQGFVLGTNGSAAGGVLVALDGSYHLRLAERRWVPFVTGGYSGFAGCGSGCAVFSGFNYGGGVNYWVKSNRGVRLEVRDHVFQDYGPVHLVEFRVGFSF
jgi:hypothetical protein